MNNAQFINDFLFLRYQKNKNYSYAGYNSGNGAPSYFFVWLVKGSVQIKSQKKSIKVSEGEIFFIPKGLRYQSFWEMNAESQLIFDFFGFQNFPMPDGYRYTLQTVQCTPNARQFLLDIAQTMHINCATVGKLYLFLAEVFPQMEYEIQHHNNLTEIAIDYMRSHMDFYVSDVANFCSVSESTLYGAFKKVYHMTPVEMKQMILCEKAVELLTTTSLSVEEISGKLHFSSSSYFRKVFKKCTGKTPFQIRKSSGFQL